MALSRFTGTMAIGSTGNQSVTGVGFQPNYLRFTIGSRTSGSNNFVQTSVGFTDGTRSGNHWTFWDSSGGRTVSVSTRCLGHVDRVSGSLTDIIDATFVSFDADGFTLNFSNANSNYNIYVEAFA